MANTPCEVPNCPAFAERSRKTCGPHRDARTAKDLHIARDSDGRGGKSCINCHRRFAETDFVYQTTRKRENVRKPGDLCGHAHVQCEPPTPRLSKKAIKLPEKPLLEAFIA